MSKRRAVILSVIVEGLTQAETARPYGVSEATVSCLLARCRAEGDAAFSSSPVQRQGRVGHILPGSERFHL